MPTDRTAPLALLPGTCHVLTFSPEAIQQGQSVNYTLGDDILLHILVQEDRRHVLVNNCVDGVWQHQAQLPVPQALAAASGPLEIAVLAQGARTTLALIGAERPMRLVREVDLTEQPLHIVQGNLIGLAAQDSQGLLPGAPAILDFVATFADGLAVLCGWTTVAWDEGAALVLPGSDLAAAQVLSAELLWYARPDLTDGGRGFVLAVTLPGGLDLTADLLSSLQVHSGLWQYRLRPHEGTQLLDSATGRDWMADVLARVSAGDADVLRRRIMRPAYAGQDTLDQLSLCCKFVAEGVHPVPGQGLLLRGWMIDPTNMVRAVQVCTDNRQASGNLYPHLVRLPRPDILEALGTAHDLGGQRPGFIAHAALDHAPGTALYARIELANGEVGYKPLPDPVPAGVQTLRQILGDLQLDSSELPEAFDQTLGAPLVALNTARLAQPVTSREVVFGTPPTLPRSSIIVPLYGQLQFMHIQTALLSRGADQSDELIYVLDDPGARAEALDLAHLCHAKFGLPIRLILPAENRGFGPASNLGLAHARGRTVCFLNSDVFPAEADWLDRLVGTLDSDPAIGVVGALCLYANGSIQHAGMQYRRLPRLGNWMFPDHPDKGMRPDSLPGGVRDVPGVTGACMVMPRALAQELGGFDPTYVIGDFEDADLCNRILARGRRCVLDGDVVLYHLERQSQGDPADQWRRNLTLLNAWTFNRRWHQA